MPTQRLEKSKFCYEMNVRNYIESGILESYCLDVLSSKEREEVEMMCAKYPQIRAELRSIEYAFEKYAEANAITPSYHIRERIAKMLGNLEKERVMDPDDLPLISKHSDYRKWLRFAEKRIPKGEITGQNISVITETKDVIQMLVTSVEDFDNEIHDNLNESFLILKGECECTFGDDVFKLRAGGFAEVPLYELHSVRIIEPVVAILQRVTF